MQDRQQARHIRTKRGVALLLTFAAGCVDIIGYLAIYHTFTAHMTGTTVRLGQKSHLWTLARSSERHLCHRRVHGRLDIRRTVIEIGARTRVRSIASITLLLEAGLITAVVPVFGHSSELPVLGLLAMLAAAMGLQTATLTKVGALNVHTTFVTGILDKLAQLLSQLLFLTYDLGHGLSVGAIREKTIQRAQFIGSSGS